MSLDEIINDNDDESTWFQAFLDRKTENYNQSVSDVISENKMGVLREELAAGRK